METPAPPALCEERIGKETACRDLPARLFSFLKFLPKVMSALHDKFGRAITDLRISITDRCNYKCVYCRTGNEGALYGDLPFADYLRMARVLVGMGITKVRLTGGEAALLAALAARPNEVLSREDIAETLGMDESGERAIDVQITRLRRKVEADPREPRFLHTVRGRGYVLKPGI